MKVLVLVLAVALAAHAAPPSASTDEVHIKEVTATSADTPAPVDATKPADAPVDAAKPADAPVDVTKPDDAPVDATKYVDTPVDATKPADAPVDATKHADAPVDVTKPADTPVDTTKPADTPVSTEAPARAEVPTVATPTLKGTCQCAALKKEIYVEEDLIGTKNMSFTVDCNEKGHKECRDMCVALAKVNKLKAPKKTCEILTDLPVGLKPTLFSKACNVAEWTYTDTKHEHDICCHEGLPIPCKVNKVETH